ncbi:c-type cytochrome [Roseivivax halotolerans]|nr:cytochrome c [Roseivivax halotolerans]
MMLASLGLAACSPAPEPSIPARGAKLFQQTCAACHGADGRGGSAPDLTRLIMDGSGTFPSIETLNRMHEGGDAMPAFRDLALGPTVVVEIEEGIGTPVPEDMLAIWRYLETIQRPDL